MGVRGDSDGGGPDNPPKVGQANRMRGRTKKTDNFPFRRNRGFFDGLNGLTERRRESWTPVFFRNSTKAT